MSPRTKPRPLLTRAQQEIDELIDEWVPEPLVPPQTAMEELESERLPVIVGYVSRPSPSAAVLSVD